MSRPTPVRASERSAPPPGRAARAESRGGSVRLGSYLRRLREGYGYTLRKVEERADAFGEAIDNSQLSRFEKGKAVPSFDKLRALARVFNVPVQSFSDVIDLEEFHELKPRGEDFTDLLRDGAARYASGEFGHAFVTYERALELADAEPDERRAAEMTAEARWRMAVALKALGKLYMTEQELREILKQRHLLPDSTRLRSLLQLTYLYRELGDRYLASVLAKECLELARGQGDRATEAGVLNTLGNIHLDDGDAAAALESYREAMAILDGLDGLLEVKATAMTNLGGCLVAVGDPAAGRALLERALAEARRGGFRRVAALALSRLAEAHRRSDESAAAKRCFDESDALASRPDGVFHDVLFLNAFHRWEIARDARNSTGEKIAFGRLRHLRAQLQRRFPEVDRFDRYIEGSRR